MTLTRIIYFCHYSPSAMFNTVRQLHKESLYVCSKDESKNVCSTQTYTMQRKSEARMLSDHAFFLCSSAFTYCCTFNFQSPGPYAPLADTYYDAEALPKGPLTKVAVSALQLNRTSLPCKFIVNSMQVQYPIPSW